MIASDEAFTRTYLQVSIYNRDLQGKKQRHKREAPKATANGYPFKMSHLYRD